MKTSLIWCIVLGAILVHRAQAAVIRGIVTAPIVAGRPHAQVNPYAGSARALAGSHEDSPAGPMDAVVYVESVPEGTAVPDSRPTPRLSQKDQRFAPRVVAVERGGAVDFPNMDPIFHNVFSVSPTRRFDLGKYPRGHSKQVTFSRPGLVKVYCDIHSDMEGFILVTPNPFFAHPDDQGHFELPALPPGHYRIHVWHPEQPELTREVDLKSVDQVVSLSF